MTTILVWESIDDPRRCPICKELQGYTWQIPTSTPFPPTLQHPKYGDVWDVTLDQSFIHTHYPMMGECRCRIHLVSFDLADISSKIHEIKEELQKAVDQSELIKSVT